MILQFEKKLIEEAIFHHFDRETKAGRQALARQFRLAWNAVYEIQDEEEREKRFAEVAAEAFQEIGFEKKFFSLLEEFPFIRQKVAAVLVRLSYRKTEEGADLFMKNGEHSIVIRISFERFLDEPGRDIWLRENLLRVEDVLDPAFGYNSADFSAARLGPRAVVVEERYRLLWLENARARAKHPETPRFTHAEFLAKAQAAGPAAKLRRDCPLCRFPTRDWSQNSDAAVLQEIKNDFPEWSQSSGICRRCYEIYEAKKKGFYVQLPGAAQPT